MLAITLRRPPDREQARSYGVSKNLRMRRRNNRMDDDKPLDYKEGFGDSARQNPNPATLSVKPRH